ncbi:MAG: sigma-70 family RNA polymerase sigma factor, partial [Clostridia bacterium]|nr:sigma-70 family RNA polymerase sigma factor [Clostridia bacterium]
ICSDDNAFDKLEADEQNEVISSALKKLDKKDQDILIRYYYYNQSTKQISIETNTNLETIKSRLNRSRKKLKDIFEEGGYFK